MKEVVTWSGTQERLLWKKAIDVSSCRISLSELVGDWMQSGRKVFAEHEIGESSIVKDASASLSPEISVLSFLIYLTVSHGFSF